MYSSSREYAKRAHASHVPFDCALLPLDIDAAIGIGVLSCFSRMVHTLSYGKARCCEHKQLAKMLDAVKLMKLKKRCCYASCGPWAIPMNVPVALIINKLVPGLGLSPVSVMDAFQGLGFRLWGL